MVWLVSYLLDPYYTPPQTDVNTELGPEWTNACRNLLGKFYTGEVERERTMQQFYDLVLWKTDWGDEIRRRRSVISNPGRTFDSCVERVIWQQQQMVSVQSAWEVVGKNALPLIGDLGLRLSTLAVQSANVERVCKAHGVIHTKSRNRLTNQSVHNLLFCYVNLRLLRKESTLVAKFLLSAIEDELDDDDELVEGEDDNKDEDDDHDHDGIFVATDEELDS